MNENWIPLADTDVFSAASGERTQIAAAKGADDLPGICAQVVAQIRGAYAEGGRPLGDAGTIPESMKFRAIAIATWRFVSEGIPTDSENLSTKARQEAFNEAVDYLDKIALRTLKGTGSAQIVSQPDRRATRTRLSGLF